VAAEVPSKYFGYYMFCMVMLAFFSNTVMQNLSAVKTHLFKLEVCQTRIYLFRLVFTEFL